MYYHKNLRLGLLLAGLSVAQPPGQAAAQDVTENVRVTDPGSPAPVAENVLRHRVAVAAAKVCGEVVGAGLWQSNAYTDCVRQARRDAEPSVEAVLVRRDGAGIAVASASPPPR